MKLIWGLLCQNAIIDRQTNLVSLINVLEEVQLPEEPPRVEGTQPMIGLQGAAVLVMLWARSDEQAGETGHCRIQLRGPDGAHSVSSARAAIDLTAFLRIRFLAQFPGFPYVGPGTYHFEVQAEEPDQSWTTVFELPLRVALQPPS